MTGKIVNLFWKAMGQQGSKAFIVFMLFNSVSTLTSLGIIILDSDKGLCTMMFATTLSLILKE